MGTSNAVMAAVLVQGTTIIEQAAKEPEIADLCYFLQRMGAKIQGIGSSTLAIEGVSTLHGAEFTIQPDRIEAGTFVILGLLCGNPLKLVGASKEFLQPVLQGFFASHPDLEHFCRWEGDCLVVSQATDLSPLDIRTAPYPGFPTDLQPQISILASQIRGESRICDTVFPERFAHVSEFERLGMDIKQSPGTVHITGKTKLQGASVAVTDLRAGAALYLGARLGEGESVLKNVECVDRGYENLDEKLRGIGASVQRIEV
jgi:UDP-N-acetylglucosamine 1-carboxyvinyltransferase